jgi:hypothetical protein
VGEAWRRENVREWCTSNAGQKDFSAVREGERREGQRLVRCRRLENHGINHWKSFPVLGRKWGRNLRKVVNSATSSAELDTLCWQSP